MVSNIKYELLKLLSTKVANYKGIPINIFGLPVFKNKNPKSVQNIFYLMKKEGYLKVEDKNVLLTNKGKVYLKERFLKDKFFNYSFPKDASKNLLLMYDIPEEQKSEREWFRRQLRKFGYIMIQRSVWVGPSPLPKEFLLFVKSIGLKDSIKTFKLAKTYTKF